MGKIWQQIRLRAKALVAAAGLAVVGMAEYVVTAPETAQQLGQTLPAPYSQLVPVLLGLFAAALVHQVPNAQPVASSEAVPAPVEPAQPPIELAPLEPSTATSMVQLVSAPGGGN